MVDLQQKKPSYRRCAELQGIDGRLAPEKASVQALCGFSEPTEVDMQQKSLRGGGVQNLGTGASSVAAPHLMVNFRKNASMVVK